MRFCLDDFLQSISEMLIVALMCLFLWLCSDGGQPGTERNLPASDRKYTEHSGQTGVAK